MQRAFFGKKSNNGKEIHPSIHPVQSRAEPSHVTGYEAGDSHSDNYSTF